MHLSPPADLFGEQGIIVLIVVALVLFGSTQIPKLARSLGSAQKEFKKGLEEGGSEEGKADGKAEGKAAASKAESSSAPNPAAPAPGATDTPSTSS